MLSRVKQRVSVQNRKKESPASFSQPMVSECSRSWQRSHRRLEQGPVRYPAAARAKVTYANDMRDYDVKESRVFVLRSLKDLDAAIGP